LPQRCINTALANTPSPGKVTLVSAGSSLQTALNNASCGDTLQLQAGATFTGVFLVPAKGCDSGHWITIESTGVHSLPAEGTRVSPCYAGVTSLPGRPAFNCTSSANVMAKIMMISTAGSGPLQFASGANYYRFVGLEITRPVGTGIVYNLISAKSGSTANHLIFDRSWIHGTAHDETTRGVALAGITHFGVVDSFFTDFHCVAGVGACTDAQAVSGGLGSLPMGVYKVVNNFLEASGENMLFGGGPASLTPSDIEVRRNHFFKPLIWKQGSAGFVGGTSGNPFLVKNHFELKNAQRVLLEANLMDRTWGGFSQAGFSVLLTPKNQNSACAICQVTDVTVRYNAISHVAGGFQIANAPADSGATALDGQRYSIHDVVVDDIQGAAYGGSGVFAQISMNAPLLQNVKISHVTAFPPNTLLYVGAPATNPMKNFIMENNIFTAGTYSIWSTGGGTSNCAYYNVPLTTFNACFSSYSVKANALLSSLTLQWPSGNWFTSMSTLQFANYSGGNYTLLSGSPYLSASTDGKPLGADVTGLVAATKGVY
jgi:hypothetical protein